MITFRDIRPYISKIDRVSICNQDTLQYENYMFISDVPEKYDHMYLYGIGRIQSEFPASQAPDMVAKMMVAGGEKPADEEVVYAECVEIRIGRGRVCQCMVARLRFLCQIKHGVSENAQNQRKHNSYVL